MQNRLNLFFDFFFRFSKYLILVYYYVFFFLLPIESTDKNVTVSGSSSNTVDLCHVEL